MIKYYFLPLIVLVVRAEWFECPSDDRMYKCASTGDGVCSTDQNRIPLAYYVNGCQACSIGKAFGYQEPCLESNIQQALLLENPLVLCKDPRPQICTMEYVETCGYFSTCPKDGKCYSEFSSGCNACSNKNVKAYRIGSCRPNLVVMTESSKTPIKCSEPRRLACTKEYRNTCGIYGQTIQCKKSPCGQQYGNPCTACADPNVDSYYLGDC